MAHASIHWTASRRDRQALAQRHDWSSLTGLEQLWPELARLHGDGMALEAPHAAEPETFSYRQLHQGIEQVAKDVHARRRLVQFFLMPSLSARAPYSFFFAAMNAGMAL